MSGTLSSEDRERLERLFDQATELPGSEHAEFVERECGSNETLREELERLLVALAGEDYLDQLQVGAPMPAGTRIGAYRLLERVGVGGMGEVYSAEQLEPVLRRVALKVIKPGMDSVQVVARFEAERQALARMTHPNVAQVFDGGATTNGRPYFVMEFVDGESITDHCNRQRLGTRERLELFLAVCEGVQHAHQKGLIHRDLKPSNLLVTESEGRAVPKIIDFGVARATTGRLAEQSLHTLVGQVVGTLDYMSPEQADPSNADVDTRSDVYSLGVLLYELVSGLLPFEHDTALDQPLSEIQRTIRETDPPTPSTRLKRETGTRASIAPLHGTNERSLIHQLTGDVDWICLKALEKDPGRRYQTALELAQDVRRHLDHMPVFARRPSALYLGRKFVRRHRVGVAAGLLVTAGLVAGVLGIVAGRIEAEANAEVARAALEQVLRLTDDREFRELVAQAEELWPAHPDKLAAMEQWVDRANATVDRLEGHRGALAIIRNRALPWSSIERELDRETHPKFSALQKKQNNLEGRIKAAERGLKPEVELRNLERIAVLESEVEDLMDEVESRRTWSFAVLADEQQHDLLFSVVVKLEQLQSGLLHEDVLAPERELTPEHGWSVPGRMRYARELDEGFGPDGDYARIWNESLPEIRAAYPGLEDLEAQMGLLPLGVDPRSGLWEFAHLMSGEPAQRNESGVVMTGRAGIVLVLLPRGAFIMGAQSEDADWPNYDPQCDPETVDPPRLVSFDEPFFLSKYELTQGQWKSFEDSSGTTGWPADNKPVNTVTWTQCNRVARRLGLSLPTAEQWEYAARGALLDDSDDGPWEYAAGAAGHSVWWTGNEEISLRGAANLKDKLTPSMLSKVVFGSEASWEDDHPVLGPVGTLRPNPFGLHNMPGNVSEWTKSHPTRRNAQSGKIVPWEGGRIARGGNWASPPFASHSAYNGWTGDEEFNFLGLGMRPARAVDWPSSGDSVTRGESEQRE